MYINVYVYMYILAYTTCIYVNVLVHTVHVCYVHIHMQCQCILFLLPPYSMHQAKQDLENSCVELQSRICALEQVVSDAGKEVLHVTETHRQTMDRER